MCWHLIYTETPAYPMSYTKKIHVSSAMFVLLIAFSVVVNFLIGGRITASKGRVWLVIGVVFNLGLLCYYKYVGFFVENLSALGFWLIPVPKITLPLAISFFTFQQIAYLVDVARGECKEYRFLQYALFVSFFPQLIAGPIVHHREMMPQFDKLRRKEELWPDLAVGLTIIALGLFKKVVLSDSLAQYSDPLFEAASQGATITTIDAWIVAFSFSFQIYFDFSGYSDMAIGSARLFGIRLPENFRSPYKSTSIIDFWRRWHMTLSRFLRDYLYFSLGGNRHGSARRYGNLLLTMLLGGLWHGAAWTFVIWGGFQGVFLCINHGWRALCAKFRLEAFRTSAWMTPVYIFITSLAWSWAFVVFRAVDVKSALAIVVPGFTPFAEQSAPILGPVNSASLLGQVFTVLGVVPGGYFPVYTLLAICAFVCWFLPNTQQYMRRYDPVLGNEYTQDLSLLELQWRPGWVSACLVALMLSGSLLSLSDVTEFIYFQF